MRQRLSLARALIHRPKVLFLDEPTSGLDPESAQRVNGLIRNLAGKQGTTVFLCTHQLRYAQEICTRYGLIDAGSLLAAGTLEELRAKVDAGAELRIRAGNIPEEMKCIEYVEGERGKGDYGSVLCMKIRSEEEIPQIVRSIVGAGGDIYEVEVMCPALEDIYFSLTEKKKEGQL